MLEEQALLLQSGQPQTARRIVAPTSGTLLGLVRRQPPVSWWQWLGPRVLAVHEAEDEPLLCTLRRSWGRPWQVRDADGHLVATVGRGLILNRWDRVLALLEHAAGGHGVRFVDRNGRELATVTGNAEGSLLRFAGEVAGEPFVKMAILAAALVLGR